MSNAGRVLVNVGHINHQIDHPNFGAFKIPGRGLPGAEKARFTKLVVPEKLRFAEDKGWGDPGPDTLRGRRIITVDGADVVKEMLRNYLSSIGDKPERPFKLGLFLAAGDEPTEEELVQAEARYQNDCEMLVDQANGIWSRVQNVRMIDDKSKMAARVLGIPAPWAPNAGREARKKCGGCGEMVSSGLAVHRRSATGEDCGYIFDMEAAKRMIGVEIPDHKKPKAAPEKAQAGL